MSGGVSYCIVPGYMEAKNDIRLLPGHDPRNRHGRT